MKRKYPDLFSGHVAQRRNGRQDVARVSRDTPPRQGGRRTVRLTDDDRRNMVRFSLDPRNPDQVREYVKNKIEAESASR